MSIEAEGSLAVVVMSFKIVHEEMHPMIPGKFWRVNATVNHRAAKTTILYFVDIWYDPETRKRFFRTYSWRRTNRRLVVQSEGPVHFIGHHSAVVQEVILMEDLQLVFTGSEERSTITHHITLGDTGPSPYYVSHVQYLVSQFLSVVPVFGPEGSWCSVCDAMNG